MTEDFRKLGVRSLWTVARPECSAYDDDCKYSVQSLNDVSGYKFSYP